MPRKEKVRHINQMLDEAGILDPTLRVKFADAILSGRITTMESLRDLVESTMNAHVQTMAGTTTAPPDPATLPDGPEAGSPAAST